MYRSPWISLQFSYPIGDGLRTGTCLQLQPLFQAKQSFVHGISQAIPVSCLLSRPGLCLCPPCQVGPDFLRFLWGLAEHAARNSVHVPLDDLPHLDPAVADVITGSHTGGPRLFRNRELEMKSLFSAISPNRESNERAEGQIREEGEIVIIPASGNLFEGHDGSLAGIASSRLLALLYVQLWKAISS